MAINKLSIIILSGNEEKIISKCLRSCSFADEIVLVANANHPLAYKNSIKLDDLKTIPILLREPGSGTLETIAFELKNLGVKLADLNLEMQLANTESIKAYLLHSNCMSFVSIHSILQELKNKTLVIIDVKNLMIVRDFYFIQSQGEQAAIANLFLKFANNYNFK